MKKSASLPRGLPRAVEVAAAALGLLAATPLILAGGLLTCLTSRGFPFFRQERVGRAGRRFTLYKLRTMRSGAAGPAVTARDDARITSVGRLLRRTKIDELPQLWNVLRGDMALVGPRPEVPRYVDLSDPAWRRVLEARPGVTDPVTLGLRSEEDLLGSVSGDRELFYLRELQPRKLKGYVQYLEHRTWRSDIEILLQTARELLTPSRWVDRGADSSRSCPETASRRHGASAAPDVKSDLSVPYD